MSDGAMNAQPAWSAEDIRLRVKRLGWGNKTLARELQKAARPDLVRQLPSRASVERVVRLHQAGGMKGGPRSLYSELYRRVFAAHGVLNLEPGAQSDAGEGLACDPLVLAWTVGRLDQRVDRRALFQHAAFAVGGAALDPVERLMRVLGGDHRPDQYVAGHLEDRTKGFHRLEEHYPAKTLYPALMTHLSELSALLEGNPSIDLRPRLAVAAGESAVLASWFAWELGDSRRSAHASLLANLAARHTADPAIAACMAGYRTYMTGGDHRLSVRIASSALEMLGDKDPITRAWLLARHAEECALAGDKKAALDSISRAEDIYVAANPTPRVWNYFLDPGRFASMSMAVYSRVKEEEKAVLAIGQIKAHLGPATETKKLCVVEADLALARLRFGDVNEAVAHARTSLEATAALAHPLGWTRLDQVINELVPASAKSSGASDFRSEYASARPSTDPPSLL